MPHLTIEYSANLADRVDPQRLVDRCHAAALDTGLFRVGAVRTRAVAREWYRIADGHPDNGFVAAILRIAPGRDAAAKRTAGEKIFGALCDELKPTFDTSPLGISFEIQEINQPFNFKRNNLHDIVEQRAGRTEERSS